MLHLGQQLIAGAARQLGVHRAGEGERVIQPGGVEAQLVGALSEGHRAAEQFAQQRGVRGRGIAQAHAARLQRRAQQVAVHGQQRAQLQLDDEAAQRAVVPQAERIVEHPHRFAGLVAMLEGQADQRRGQRAVAQREVDRLARRGAGQQRVAVEAEMRDARAQPGAQREAGLGREAQRVGVHRQQLAQRDARRRIEQRGRREAAAGQHRRAVDALGAQRIHQQRDLRRAVDELIEIGAGGQQHRRRCSRRCAV